MELNHVRREKEKIRTVRDKEGNADEKVSHDTRGSARLGVLRVGAVGRSKLAAVADQDNRSIPCRRRTDFVGRLVADHLSKALSQPIYVENRGGANGRRAIRAGECPLWGADIEPHWPPLVAAQHGGKDCWYLTVASI